MANFIASACVGPESHGDQRTWSYREEEARCPWQPLTTSWRLEPLLGSPVRTEHSRRVFVDQMNGRSSKILESKIHSGVKCGSMLAWWKLSE